MKTVRILGTASSLANAPPPNLGEETWIANARLGYTKIYPRALEDWTRWFNLHSRKHQKGTYLRTYNYQRKLDGSKPIYNQKVNPEIPGSTRFPGPELQEYFKTSDKPFRYFTFSGAWLIAFAIYLGFDRIELWGFEVAHTKPAYSWERPCFFYWIHEARKRGIEVILSQAVDLSKGTEPGDPDTYTGPLYGYDTKPELEL